MKSEMFPYLLNHIDEIFDFNSSYGRMTLYDEIRGQ